MSAHRHSTDPTPQAAYQARRRAKSAPVSFFPADKAALDRAVLESGMTQQAWLVAVVETAILSGAIRTPGKGAASRPRRGLVDDGVSTSSEATDQLPVRAVEQFELTSQKDWLGQVSWTRTDEQDEPL